MQDSYEQNNSRLLSLFEIILIRTNILGYPKGSLMTINFINKL
jgi:hypothetical protein